MPHPLEKVIASADAAIVSEDFDTLVEFYSDDAVLVIKPGMSVTGRAAIRSAFERIAEHFNHSVQVEQAGMVVLEGGDTALVLARTVVSASNLPAATRNATYVFRKDGNGRWRCTIDNSYGHDLLSVGTLEGANRPKCDQAPGYRHERPPAAEDTPRPRPGEADRTRTAS